MAGKTGSRQTESRQTGSRQTGSRQTGSRQTGQPDVVVLGAGHNGLVAAAYLARAGRSVVVLEGGDDLGGSAATDEIAPGFRCPAAFASVEHFAPEIVSELGLEGHGLRLLDGGGVLVPDGDGEALYLPAGDGGRRAAQAISERSPADGEAFLELDGFLRRLADALAPVFAAPLPDLEPTGLPGIFDLVRPGWRLRSMGARDFAETLRFLPMPVADVVGERFSDPRLQAAIAAGGTTGSWLGPRSPGSAMNLLLHRLGACRGALAAPRFAAGGPGALAAALAAAARAAGAEIRTAAEVRRLRVADGRIAGVVLADGEEMRAEAVVSCADVRKTLLEWVEPRHLEPSFVRSAQAIRGRGTVAIVQLALDRLPAIAGADASRLAGRILISACVDDIERAFDDVKYGRLPERPILDVTIPSVADPQLAPEGKHVLHAWVQYPPYNLRESSWDEGRGRLADVVIARLAEHAPGLADVVRERRVLAPPDLERRFGVTEGCLYQVEPALDQMLYLRPMARWARHETPIAGLYLGGAGSHGGGGLTGRAGRNAARRVLRDES